MDAAETKTAMKTAAETLTVLRGVVEGLQMDLNRARDENEGLALTVESLKEENEKLRIGAAAENAPEVDEDIRQTLEKKLAFYYRDMKKIDPKTITAEDGETLFHILEYTFKALKKAGLEL